MNSGACFTVVELMVKRIKMDNVYFEPPPRPYNKSHIAFKLY